MERSWVNHYTANHAAKRTRTRRLELDGGY